MAKKPVPEVGDLIMLYWVDIQEDSAWREVGDEGGELTTCRSVGWVVRVDKNVVALTRTYGKHSGEGEEFAGDSIVFPRGCVTSFRVLSKA